MNKQIILKHRPQKSNHKIRKTCISNMISFKQLSNEEIRAFAGHEDFSTTVPYNKK